LVLSSSRRSTPAPARRDISPRRCRATLRRFHQIGHFVEQCRFVGGDAASLAGRNLLHLLSDKLTALLAVDDNALQPLTASK
jgi:hypothetical protein